jgi:hypothetical protein
VVSAFADGGWFTVWLLVALGVLGGVLGGVVTGAYLAACNACPRFEAHPNEAFAAMRLPSYKNFLRLHIDATGVLHVYPIGIRRTVERWRLDPDSEEDASWLAPEGEAPAAHLIEPPFAIDGRSR